MYLTFGYINTLILSLVSGFWLYKALKLSHVSDFWLHSTLKLSLVSHIWLYNTLKLSHVPDFWLYYTLKLSHVLDFCLDNTLIICSLIFYLMNAKNILISFLLTLKYKFVIMSCTFINRNTFLFPGWITKWNEFVDHAHQFSGTHGEETSCMFSLFIEMLILKRFRNFNMNITILFKFKIIVPKFICLTIRVVKLFIILSMK